MAKASRTEKRGQKRKNAAAITANSNGPPLTSPDRVTWPGWVEMESEPAFFNAMLQEIGARGVKIQEVISMDPEMLATLPQPVYGLIFLFKYRTEDEQQQQSAEGTEHIWFANQIPDFACATVALLNIVNNIPQLEMGKELHDFKEFTNNMNPVQRGEMIDSFDFVRRVHNSFARESDMLNADMHSKSKFDKFKKQEATAKARATKEAKKAKEAAQAVSQVTSPDAYGSVRACRGKKPAENGDSVAPTKWDLERSRKSLEPDADYDTTKASSKRELDGPSEGLRRSTRAPKPRRDLNGAQVCEDDGESGFHFIAYVPVDNHVWKLDGLDCYPTDMGPYGNTEKGTDHGNNLWIDAVSPTILNRMLQFQDGSIEYSLMAVVHDPAAKERRSLLANIKALQAIAAKLGGIAEDWRDMEGTETNPEVITGTSVEFAISQGDIDVAALPEDTAEAILEQEDLLELIELRQRMISDQTFLRASLRDFISASYEEDKQVRHRRHDYNAFVRGWLGALAENGVLADLIDNT